MNRAILMGNFTDEPRIRQTQSGKKIADFTLAVGRGKDGTDFINCIAWEQKADFVEKYCHKGMKFLIEGRIQTGSYEKDGRKVKTFDIVVDSIEFCERKKEEPRENPEEFVKIPEGLEEDMPFN